LEFPPTCFLLATLVGHSGGKGWAGQCFPKSPSATLRGMKTKGWQLIGDPTRSAGAKRRSSMRSPKTANFRTCRAWGHQQGALTGRGPSQGTVLKKMEFSVPLSARRFPPPRLPRRPKIKLDGQTWSHHASSVPAPPSPLPGPLAYRRKSANPSVPWAPSSQPTQYPCPPPWSPRPANSSGCRAWWWRTGSEGGRGLSSLTVKLENRASLCLFVPPGWSCHLPAFPSRPAFLVRDMHRSIPDRINPVVRFRFALCGESR